MKKKIKCIIISIILLCCMRYIVDYFSSDFYFWDIKKVIVKSSLDSIYGKYYVTDKEEEIAVLKKCLFKCYMNNKFRTKRNILIAPIDYEITYFFEDSKSKTCNYKAYPSTFFDNPFGDFYSLYDTEKQN